LIPHVVLGLGGKARDQPLVSSKETAHPGGGSTRPAYFYRKVDEMLEIRLIAAISLWLDQLEKAERTQRFHAFDRHRCSRFGRRRTGLEFGAQGAHRRVQVLAHRLCGRRRSLTLQRCGYHGVPSSIAEATTTKSVFLIEQKIIDVPLFSG
jgi:hypothetical protein